MKKEQEPSPVKVKTEDKARKDDEQISPAKPVAAATTTAATTEQNEQKETTPKTEKEQDEKVSGQCCIRGSPLVVTCQQVATNLSILSSCNKSTLLPLVISRLVTTC